MHACTFRACNYYFSYILYLEFAKPILTPKAIDCMFEFVSFRANKESINQTRRGALVDLKQEKAKVDLNYRTETIDIMHACMQIRVQEKTNKFNCQFVIHTSIFAQLKAFF